MLFPRNCDGFHSNINAFFWTGKTMSTAYANEGILSVVWLFVSKFNFLQT